MPETTIQLPIYQRDDKILVCEFLQAVLGTDYRPKVENLSFEDWSKLRATHYATAVCWKLAVNFPDDAQAEDEYVASFSKWARQLFTYTHCTTHREDYNA